MTAEMIALAARLEHERELVVFQIPQAAVDQLRRLAAGPAREISLLDQGHAQPAHGGVTGDASAVDAAADHQQVEGRLCESLDDGGTTAVRHRTLSHVRATSSSTA